MESKFLERFKNFKSTGRLHGDLIRIEIVESPSEEDGTLKTKGGLHIPKNEDPKSDLRMLKSVIGVVLEVGKGYYDPDKGEDVPLDVQVGGVVWVPAQSVGYCSTIPELKEALPDKSIALVNESQVRKSWNTLEDYLSDIERFNVDD